VPRVRSPIKGDLYRGSLLNFWCVRPGKAQARKSLIKKIGQRLSGFRLRNGFFSNRDGRQITFEFFYFDKT